MTTDVMLETKNTPFARDVTPCGISTRPVQLLLAVTTKSETVNVPEPSVGPSLMQPYSPPTLTTVSSFQVVPSSPKPDALVETNALAPS